MGCRLLSRYGKRSSILDVAGSEPFRQVLVTVDDGGERAGVLLPVLLGAWAAVETRARLVRMRQFTHLFGADTAYHRQAATTIQHACERLQADRAAGIPAMGEGRLMADFHRRLAVVYTCEGAAN